MDFSIAGSVVIGCPSSNISSTSCTCQLHPRSPSWLCAKDGTHHVDDIEVVLEGGFGNVSQIRLEGIEECIQE